MLQKERAPVQALGHQIRQCSVLLHFFFFFLILGEVYEQLLREVAVTRASECARLILLCGERERSFLGAVADGLPLLLSSLSPAGGAGFAASVGPLTWTLVVGVRLLPRCLPRVTTPCSRAGGSPDAAWWDAGV